MGPGRENRFVDDKTENGPHYFISSLGYINFVKNSLMAVVKPPLFYYTHNFVVGIRIWWTILNRNWVTYLNITHGIYLVYDKKN